MTQRVVLMIVCACLALGMAKPALAVLQFQKEFLNLYAGDSESDFTKLAKEAKCFCCHQGRKSKKNHNPYGVELRKLLDKKADAKNPEKIVEALKTVAELHTDPNDEKSPTFGELIAAGKLPGGALEECQEEPAE